MEPDGQSTTRRCWAAEVSPCNGALSREHFVSRALFRGEYFDTSENGGTVQRSGVPLDGLVVRCLCERHNNDLSPLDVAAGDFFNCVHELERLRGAWSHYKGPLAPERFAISGVKLQQWAFKTAASTWCRLQKHLGSPPPAALARLALGVDQVQGRMGLALLGRVGDPIHVEERVTVQFGKNAGESLPSGLIIIAWGHTLYVAWQPIKPTTTLVALDGAWASEHIVFHPKTIRFNVGRLSAFLSLDWSANFRDDPRVVALRPRT
jgi:hypothetical protein